jgi:hypothetical protein
VQAGTGSGNFFGKSISPIRKYGSPTIAGAARTRLIILIEVKRTAMLRRGNAGF